MITILGIGSLLEEASARRTCPTLQNFRLVKVPNFKRVFNKTNSTLVHQNALPNNTKAYACVSAMPCQKITIVTSAFDIPDAEWLPFLKRESEYNLQKVRMIEENQSHNTGILCTGVYDSDTACEHACNTDPFRKELWDAFKSKYNGPMWRKDLLPTEEYLRRCLKAANTCGDEVYQNFIQTTFLGDGTTTIAAYLNLPTKEIA